MSEVTDWLMATPCAEKSAGTMVVVLSPDVVGVLVTAPAVAQIENPAGRFAADQSNGARPPLVEKP
jgi:hypothetical protein